MGDEEEKCLIPKSECNEQTKSDEMDVDTVLEKISPFGKFQILLLILIFFLLATSAFQELILYFLGYNPPWTCVSRNSSDFCNATYGKIFRRRDRSFNHRCKLKRDEWRYTVQKGMSFVTDFDLVCDKSTVASITGAIFFVGEAIGGPFGGTLADTYGRKRFLAISLIMSFAVSVITSYVSEMCQLIVMRLFSGIIVAVCIDFGWILMSEFVPTKFRPFSTNICLIAMTTSNFLIDLFAYYVRDWRMLKRYSLLPSLIFVLLSLFIPESPRWLLSVGKVEKCKAVLLKMSKINKKVLPAFHLKAPEIKRKRRLTYIGMFGVPQLRKIMLIQAVIGQTVTLTLLTSTLFLSDFGGNMYQNFAISTAISLPAYFVAIPILSRFGRKRATLIPLFLSGFLAGIIGVLLLFNNNNSSKFFVAINIASNFMATFALTGYIVWFFEQYPTVVRVRGLAFGGLVSKLGQIGAPFLTTTIANVNIALPFFLMFGMTTLASVLGLFMSETKDRSTRETIDDLIHSEEIEAKESEEKMLKGY